ncbi:MAG: lpxK [Geobacteraceae bacterium]|nr:lpxK [Geobacteraceae bacterium]
MSVLGNYIDVRVGTSFVGIPVLRFMLKAGRMSLDHYFRNLVEGKRKGLDASILLFLLKVLSVPYAIIMRLRALAYEKGFFRSRALPKPVVSVGNITVGGTGKTPVVSLIARYYIDRGKRVAVLSRGYRGQSRGKISIVSDGRNVLMTPAEAGDEPCMLAEKIPGLIVAVGTDRYQAGLHLLGHLNPDIFILDDGFQHQRLHRDLNILLLDNNRPFGNGNVFPAGLLREPKDAAGRADLIVYTRCAGNKPVGNAEGIPFCVSSHVLAGFVTLPGGVMEPLSSLSHLRGVAFAGIAEPSPFFSMLEEEGLIIAKKISFPDHCKYGEDEVSEIVSTREAVEADYVITTEKDSVKLSPYLSRLGGIHAAVLDIRIPDMAILTDKLEKLL